MRVAAYFCVGCLCYRNAQDTLCAVLSYLAAIAAGKGDNKGALCGFHFSHTNRKNVWGHQVVKMMVNSSEFTYPFKFQLFNKDKTESKIQLSIEMIRMIPKLKQPVYLLCDSWYTSRSIIESALSKGIHVIGILKTNRILYPKRIHIQAKEFTKYIHKQRKPML